MKTMATSRKRLLVVRCCVIQCIARVTLQCIAHVRSVTRLDSFVVQEDAMERVAGRLQELSRFARLPPVGSSQNFGGQEVGTLRLCCTSQKFQ